MFAQNRVKVNMIIFHSGCYLRYLLLISHTIQVYVISQYTMFSCTQNALFKCIQILILVLGIYHVFGRSMI